MRTVTFVELCQSAVASPAETTGRTERTRRGAGYTPASPLKATPPLSRDRAGCRGSVVPVRSPAPDAGEPTGRLAPDKTSVGPPGLPRTSAAERLQRHQQVNQRADVRLHGLFLLFGSGHGDIAARGAMEFRGPSAAPVLSRSNSGQLPGESAPQGAGEAADRPRRRTRN